MTAILGGGIAGLSAGFFALQNPVISPLVIFEASNRVGGWIRSIKLKDGCVFEQGPRTIRSIGPSGQNTLDLAVELGLSNKIISIKQGHPVARNRLIYARDKLHYLPNSVEYMFKKHPLLNHSLLSLAWKDLRTAKVSKEDESIYSFIERRLGQEAADNIISPMICGICAGDAREISVKSLLLPLFEAEQKYGSILKGILAKRFLSGSAQPLEKGVAGAGRGTSKTQKELSNEKLDGYDIKAEAKRWVAWGLEGGLEQLPLSLADRLIQCGVSIETEHKCERLTFKTNQAEAIINGKVRKYSHIVSALPAQNLADLVDEQHPELARELRGIPTVTVAVVNIQFLGKVLPVKGFGFLVPPKEQLPILGVLFDSCIFPQNSTVLTVMMGGTWFDKYFGECSTDEHLITVAVNHTRRILNIDESPTTYAVSILRDCIPQHVVGHAQRQSRIQDYISTHRIPLSLCGSSTKGVGLNDVILSAKEAVSNISLHAS